MIDNNSQAIGSQGAEANTAGPSTGSPGWRDHPWTLSAPDRLRLGPRTLAALTDATERGFAVQVTEQSISISSGTRRFDLVAHEDPESPPDGPIEPNWHWARFYTTVGPFPDNSDADRAIADFGLHGCFENVGMTRDDGRAFLRIGFRLAQDTDALFLDLQNIPRALQELADRLMVEASDDPIRNVIRPFAEAIHAKAKARGTLRTQGRLSARGSARFAESMLDDLKKCSDILIPSHRPVMVSKAAHDQALSLGVDLREQDWHTQPRFDKGRTIFHWEHVTPLAQLRDECIQKTSAHAIADTIEQHLFVAWITKDEDLELTRLSYKSKRPNPDVAYRESGIEIIPNDN